MNEVAKGVYRLGTRFINWYLVAEGDSLTVIDTGLPGYYDQLTGALARLGRSVSDIDAIVLTHNHSDHTGFAEKLRAMGPTVHIHEADAAAVTGGEKLQAPTGRKRDLIKPGLVPFLVHGLRNGGREYPTISDVTTFTDDKVLDVPGRPKVVYTPGHSPGHCALLLEEAGALVSGDGLVTGIPWSSQRGPRLMQINNDYQGALRSLDIFERVDAETLLPGHGDPWTGGVANAARRARELETAR